MTVRLLGSVSEPEADRIYGEVGFGPLPLPSHVVPVAVRFSPADAPAWTGAFGSCGPANFSAAHVFPDGRTVLVVAGGQGYVVDAESGELVRMTPWDYSYGVIAAPGQDFLVVADTTQIWAVTPRGDTWPNERVATDGIYLDRSDEGGVEGRAWRMGDWHEFRLDYAGWRFTEGKPLPDGQTQR